MQLEPVLMMPEVFKGYCAFQTAFGGASAVEGAIA
jgi:hypothetical protein